MGLDNVRVEPMNAVWRGPQVSEITCIADVSSSLNNQYFKIWTALDAVGHVFWFNVAAAGTAPTEPGFTLHAVAIAANATKLQVAAALQASIDATTGFSAVVFKEFVTVTNDADGLTTSTVDGTATTGFGFKDIALGDIVDLGLIDGDIQLAFKQDNFDVKAHQFGTQILDKINTGTNLDAVKITLLETNSEMISNMLGALGESFTPPAGTSEVIGIGTSRRFSVLSTIGKKLVLHPVRVTDLADLTADVCFWKATPQVDNLNFSGENASKLEVSFQIGIDLSKDAKAQIMVYGDWTQDFSA